MSLKWPWALLVVLILGVIAGPTALLLLLAAASAPPPAPSGPAGVAAIPPGVVAADTQASAEIGTLAPGCVVPPWALLAIGEVESGNLSGRSIAGNGDVDPPVIGPALDGSVPGTAVVPDTDGGSLDGDPAWDHAVGPMQILPSTWRRWARRASGTGAPDPQNVADAALTAAVILCQPPRDLSDPAQFSQALLAYNPSAAYVTEVLAWAASSAGAVGTPAPAPAPP